MTAYQKHAQFLIRQIHPFNGGPPLPLLVRTKITPAELFFVRNHGDVPTIHPNSYRLEITGPERRSLSLSLDELQHTFLPVNLPATLQCAGNRREQMMAVRPIPHELAWGSEAVSNAAWTGVRLRDVLNAVGIKPEHGLHIEFTGLDETERLGQRFPFGGSIPIEKAFRDEVLLAYEMNGNSLPPVHGFPLRVVAPGYIGARSVKWLHQMTVQPHPSENYFQSRAYRLFPPETTPETVIWEEGLMLGELSLTSVICTPGAGETVPAGEVEVRGYALAGGDRSIARVDVSADGGQTWQSACLDEPGQPWVWQFWHVHLSLRPGTYSLVVRAVDTAANVQPPDVVQIWNFKGYMNNAWHRQTLIVE